MDTKDLKFLVDKYWQGETSLKEEAALREWFTQNEAPDGMEHEAEIFKYFGKMNQAVVKENFEDRLMEKMGESGLKTVHWQNQLLNWRVAAVVSGIIVATIVLKNPFGSSTPTDTYDNPQDAYEATKAILMTISSNMNKGKKYTQQLSKFSEAQEIVSEAGMEPEGEGS